MTDIAGEIHGEPTLPHSSEYEAMHAAFLHHKSNSTKFTRRMAINIGDIFGMTPWQVVRWYEKNGVLKAGSTKWFFDNGGFRKAHFDSARRDRKEAGP